MKIEIKIEADNDAMEKIQKQFKTVASRISTVIKFFEQNFELNLKNNDVREEVTPEMETVGVVKDAAVSEKEVSMEVIPSSSEIAVSADIDSAEPSEPSVPSESLEPSESASDDFSALEKEPEFVPPVPEKKPSKKGKQSGKIKTSKKAKPKAKMKPPVRARRSTAAGAVLECIEKSKNGIDSKTLQEKTGFGAKKVADTVYQLKKKGLIKKAEKGLFVTI